MDEHGCWFDHHGLYDTNIHVPLILRCPGRMPSGRRVKGFVRLKDLAPSVLDFLGLGDLARSNRMEGESFIPMALGSSVKRGLCRELYLTESSWMRKRGIRTREWKLIVSLEPDFHGKPMVELYNLRDDPGEMVNLAGEMPEVVSRLRRKLERWVVRRLRETGKPDPMETQGITLRKVGGMKTAVPKDQKLEE